MRASEQDGTDALMPLKTGGSAPDIEFRQVTKRYGEVVAVDRVDLEVRRGAFHSLLGPSGCGKTTSLRLIAGFEQPSLGDVRIGAQSMVGVPPFRRPVNMVFQQYALFPHLNVADNVGYGLRQRSPRPGKAEIARRIEETLELVRLPRFGHRRVWELSGGQQQRVALARALINHPTVLLLDEPLAALDRKLRREMQMELQTLQREVGITFVLVTHDQEEALSMSDTISIMREGRIVQTGSPRELYDAPVNRYVADFIGQSNFFAGRLVEAGPGGARIRTDGGLEIAAPYPASAPGLNGAERAVIAVRPEVIGIVPAETPARTLFDFAVPGRILNRIYLGDQTEFSVASEALGEVLVRASKTSEAVSSGLAPGDAVVIGWRQQAGLALADS
ncbi:MAG: putative polyamine transporter ATP-binding protein [Rhodospirillales bacterium]|jgi:spermidine/putrescine transport system ATP-binding protein|nr:putative polyamine transporter ATP-binding protein [Rhodospirillales bacterium]